jgi:peptidoglycan/xylan/chitin deacetylase (PgdA/CDA1 family)
VAAALLCGGVAEAKPRDHTPPTVTITSPTATTYQQRQTVIAKYSCSDPSGVLSCSGPVPSGQPIDTRTAGSFGFTVRASDRLGNSASTSVAYKVTTAPQPWDCSNGYVALTFDDGPTGLTQQYLDTLKAGGAHATFFDIGANMTTSWGQPLVRATVAYGNDLGDHTMTHPDLTTLTDSQVQQEIGGQRQAALSVAGYTETMFRPPYGAENQNIFDVTSSLGLTQISWTYDPTDWASPPTDQTVTNVLANAHDQAIILMHDGKANTLAAIPQILSGLHAQKLCPGKLVRDNTSTLTDPWYGGFPMYVRVVPFGTP